MNKQFSGTKRTLLDRLQHTLHSPIVLLLYDRVSFEELDGT